MRSLVSSGPLYGSHPVLESPTGDEMAAHVLLVDDSTTVRMVLAAELREAKFRVTSVPTLDGARRALAHARERDPFNLAILDLQLPDGDGFDLLAEMRRDPAFAKLPVMILSSDARFDSRLRGLGIGADDFVGKPHSKAYLISRAQLLAGEETRKTDAPPPSFRIMIVEADSSVREALAKALRVCHGSDVVALETIDQAAQYLEYQGIAVEGVIVERRCYVRMLGLMKERCPSEVPLLLLDDAPAGAKWGAKPIPNGTESRTPLSVPRSLDPTVIAGHMYKRMLEASKGPKLTSSSTIPKNVISRIRDKAQNG